MKSQHLPQPAVAPNVTIPDFPNLTPMLVMPFSQFKSQGRIMKSVKSWRDEALAKGWLVAFEGDSGKVAIFISHTCAHALLLYMQRSGCLDSTTAQPSRYNLAAVCSFAMVRSLRQLVGSHVHGRDQRPERCIRQGQPGLHGGLPKGGENRTRKRVAPLL